MNCIEFRRTHASAPGSPSRAQLAHARECESCRAYLSRAGEFEQSLQRAMQVDPPANLASRILLKQSFEKPTRSGAWRRGAYGLAASVLLALTLIGGMSYVRNLPPPLEREVVQLINQATHTLQARGPVERDKLVAQLRAVGFEIDGQIPDLTFVGPCYVRGKLSGHLVMKGDVAPVTVLLMCHETVTRRVRFASGAWQGVIIPTEQGAMAVVGAPGEVLDGFEDRVRAAVRWPA